MAVYSYLVTISTEIPVTLNHSNYPDTNFIEHVMEKAQEIIDDFDLNSLKYSMAITGFVEEVEGSEESGEQN